MPWRKYNPTKGKYGPIYNIGNGIQVRLDSNKKWILFIEKNGKRKNKTFGSDKKELSKAIKTGEALASRFVSNCFSGNEVQPESRKPLFKNFSKDWLENGAGRWDEQTYERYEGILRLHIWPNLNFKNKRLDEINRSLVKEFLRGLLRIRSASTVELAQIIIYGIFDDAIDDAMIKAEETIANHYGQNNLEGITLTALENAGKNIDALTRDDIASFDEFHFGGRAETRRLAGLAQLEKGMHVLDVGSGVGGAARTLAGEFGCQVSGLDLTEAFTGWTISIG